MVSTLADVSCGSSPSKTRTLRMRVGGTGGFAAAIAGSAKKRVRPRSAAAAQRPQPASRRRREIVAFPPSSAGLETSGPEPEFDPLRTFVGPGRPVAREAIIGPGIPTRRARRRPKGTVPGVLAQPSASVRRPKRRTAHSMAEEEQIAHLTNRNGFCWAVDLLSGSQTQRLQEAGG